MERLIAWSSVGFITQLAACTLASGLMRSIDSHPFSFFTLVANFRNFGHNKIYEKIRKAGYSRW